ncbi:MAG: spore germination protein [Bacillus sp. (in: Bacteria)]|nr:spore germination protein [Bacillus sp. (in: firmicutes)]
MPINREGICIGTVSGGIVNFGGAERIAPVSVTRTTSGSGSDNTGQDITTNSGLSSIQRKRLNDLIEFLVTIL